MTVDLKGDSPGPRENRWVSAYGPMSRRRKIRAACQRTRLGAIGQAGQNRTVHEQPHAPRHTIPLKVCPRAAMLTVTGSQIALSRDPALDPEQT